MKNNAVQQHGIDFENLIHHAWHGISKSEYEKKIPGGYTSKWDIMEGIHSDSNVSVKVTKSDGIGFGDILRLYKATKEEPFTLVVGCFFQKSKTIKSYYEILEIYFEPKYHKLLWGGITLKEIESFVDYVKNISPGKESQSINQKIWKEKREDMYKKRGLISIDAKIDSKTQRRVQCGVKLKELMSSSIKFARYDKNYRDKIDLPYFQYNTPVRSFNFK
tara:strand:- start:40576 stop:41232 length:657 start_codon:yes stop_codon:yes gene_type:complete